MAERRPERHLVLVGLPGAGKTSVGRQVATLLRRPFVDLDDEIERHAGKTVTALFAAEGEPGFRQREADVSVTVAGREPAVIAPGGGWMTNLPAVATLRPAGRIIYLRVSPATAIDRMGATLAARPLLAGSDPHAALQALLERRRALYSVADHTLDTEALSVREVAETLVALTSAWERSGA